MAPNNGASSSYVVSLDQTSPYFVHSSDGPSSVTVTPLLNGSNYLFWAHSMRRALGGKMKYEFVDGTIPLVTNMFDPYLMQEIYSLQQDSKLVTTFYYELKVFWKNYKFI